MKKLFAAVAAISTLSACLPMGDQCTTVYNSSLGRGVYGDATTAWRGAEAMNTQCTYSGRNPPQNLKAPAHLGHMQGAPAQNGYIAPQHIKVN